MTIVSAPTALTVVGPATSADGVTFNEQNCDTTNGNRFANAKGTELFVRNTTASPIFLDFYADFQGVECLYRSISIPGSGTVNGEKQVGPFDTIYYNEHSASVVDLSAQNSVVFKQRSGSAGDLKVCPIAPKANPV